jgi:hypothetical protein
MELFYFCHDLARGKNSRIVTKSAPLVIFPIMCHSKMTSPHDVSVRAAASISRISNWIWRAVATPIVHGT